jgi:hypothetical protein
VTQPDSITFRGPEDVPDVWCPEYTDEDGVVIPAHMVDMSRAFKMVAEARGECGHLHGYVMIGDRDLIDAWGSGMADYYRSELTHQVMQRLNDCKEGCACHDH